VLTSRKDLSNDLQVMVLIISRHSCPTCACVISVREEMCRDKTFEACIYKAQEELGLHLKAKQLEAVYYFCCGKDVFVSLPCSLLNLAHGGHPPRHSQVIRQVFSARQCFVNTHQYLAILSHRISNEG